MSAQTRLIYEFDDFQLEPDERKLVRHGQVVPLHGKAFELLLALIRNRGRLLTKDEILEQVWPDQIVEESNLTVNMSAVRRALGERASNPRYITTISGRGYRFTGDVRQFADESLTIEHESFARMVVQQEEVDSGTFGVSGSQIRNAVGQLTRPLILCAMGLVLAVIAGSGLWLRGSLHRASAAPLPWANVTPRRFVTNGGVPFRVAISPDGKSLVYAQRTKGQNSLWLGQIETNSSVIISDRPDVSYFGVAFSRDGQSIYLSENDAHSVTRLMRMPVIGGVPTELTTNIDSAVTLSPDGRQLAFLRRGDRQSSIVITDADGKNERTLATRKRPESFSGYGLSWSPDGKNIAVSASEDDNKPHQVLAIAVADGAAKKIGNHEWGFVSNLVWQSDGSGLLSIVRNSRIARRSSVWFIPYPDGEPRKVTNDLSQYYGETMSLPAKDQTLAVLVADAESEIWLAPEGDASRARLALQGVATSYEGIDGLAWTPDGHLLFSGYVGDGQVIWEMSGDGLNRKQLTSNVGDSVDRQMSATADNRFIVFQSNRSGAFEIWRANRDGSNLKQLTSEGNNSQPGISPDGKWIVYVSEQEGSPTLRRISIDGGQPAQLTYNASSGPQISPDGKQIAYLESSSSMPLHLTVIPFWGSENPKVFSLPLRQPTNLAKRMRWSPDGKSIIYKDSGAGLWRQRLDTDKPEPVRGFEDLQIYQLAWSLDGKTLAYTRGANMQEIVLLQSAK
jgi:Tol biopolymer transport system component/DNA-binding winged helix-turn-helix (wHTH) protein